MRVESDDGVPAEQVALSNVLGSDRFQGRRLKLQIPVGFTSALSQLAERQSDERRAAMDELKRLSERHCREHVELVQRFFPNGPEYRSDI